MAFYNPQRVVFNPDTGVIQNAGKVGGVLYDIMSKSFDDKVKANEFQQEQDLRKQQLNLIRLCKIISFCKMNLIML